MPSNGPLDGPAAGHDAYYTPKWRIAIKNFSPIWFIFSMDTGILSIILNLLPYRFSGQGILSTIMFVFNLVVFSSFVLISIIRLSLYPRHAKFEAINTVEEISYMGAPTIAYLTLVAQVSLTCSTAWGHGWTIFAYVLWWIGLFWTVTTCSTQVILFTKRSITDDRSISPAIFLPLIGVMTQATTGGIVVNYSYNISARLAVPVIIVSFMCIGYALLLAILYYAIYMHRLIAVGTPKMPKLPSMIICVGPLGQAATAIQLLGTAAYTRGDFAGYGQGTFLTANAASTVSAVCTMLALLIVGFGFFWITIAWYIVVESLIKRELPFSITWWSMIFPMGVFTTAMLNLSIAMNSPAFRGITAGLLIFLFIIYFFNLFFTTYRIFTGVALMIPQEREEEKKQEMADRGKANGHNV